VQLITNTSNAIADFFINNVSDYDTTFKYSNLLTAIDVVDTSYSSNLTEIEISTYFLPGYGGKESYLQKYNNSLIAGSIYSTIWINKSSSNSQLKDDGFGNIDLYVNGNLQFTKVGTVDYVNGKISLTAFDAENS